MLSGDVFLEPKRKPTIMVGFLEYNDFKRPSNVRQTSVKRPSGVCKGDHSCERWVGDRCFRVE